MARTQKMAAVGLIRINGDFDIPERRELAKALGEHSAGYINSYGLRNRHDAQRELDGQAGLAGIVFASSQTGGAAEYVGVQPTQEQIDDVEDEYALRNDHNDAPSNSAAPTPPKWSPIGSKDDGQTAGGYRPPTEVKQRENDLVLRYQEWLRRPLQLTRFTHSGSDRQLEIDAYDQQTKTLIEAKSSAHRRYILLAIGQLFDYGRTIPHEVKMILLPERPERDLVELAESLGIGICYENGGCFLDA